MLQKKRRGLRLLSTSIILSMSMQLGSGVVFAAEDDTAFLSYSDEYEYEVSENRQSLWDNHMVVEYTIKNNGKKEIADWNFLVDIPYEIENVWNAQKIEGDGTYYQIGNSGWNKTIQPGQSVSFGMTLAGIKDTSNIESPSTWLLNSAQKAIAIDNLDVSYQEYSNWGSGFSGLLTITNNSDSAINGWCFDISANRPILSVSNAVLTDNGNNSYTLANAGYNATINAHSSVSINVNGGANDKSQFAAAIVKATESASAFSLTDDKDMNGVPDYQEFIEDKKSENPIITPTPTNSPTPIPTSTPTPTVVPTNTPTPIPTSTPTPTVAPTNTPTPVPTSTPTPTVAPTNTPTPIPTSTPTPTVAPTSTPTPTVAPTSTPTPIPTSTPTPTVAPTNTPTPIPTSTPTPTVVPTNTPTPTPQVEIVDSDFDGLSDADEVAWGTEILNPDTDGDTILDGDEVKMGKNPLDPADKDLKVEQTLTIDISNDEDQAVRAVSVTISLAYPIDRMLTIQDVYQTDWYTKDLYSRLGSPVSFECAEPFDTAKVVFYYADGFLDDTSEDDLGVLWYDEENCCYIEQEQAVVDKEADTVTMEVTHFSTYAMHDKDKWSKLRFPESKDCFVAHREDTYYIIKGTQLDMDAAERSVFWWYHLTVDVKRAVTLNRTATFKENWGYEEGYLIACDWLIFTEYDDDEDGTYDFLKKGYMATNGHIYTNPEPFDCIFVNRQDDEDKTIHLVKGIEEFTTSTYSGSIPEDSEDSWLQNYVDMLEPGLTSGILTLKTRRAAILPINLSDDYYGVEEERDVNDPSITHYNLYFYNNRTSEKTVLFTEKELFKLRLHLTKYLGYVDLAARLQGYPNLTTDRLLIDLGKASDFDFDGDGDPDCEDRDIKSSDGNAVRYCVLRDLENNGAKIYVNYIDDMNFVMELDDYHSLNAFLNEGYEDYKVLQDSDSQKRTVNKYVTFISIDRQKAEKLDFDGDGIADFKDVGNGPSEAHFSNGQVVRYCIVNKTKIYVNYIDDANLIVELQDDKVSEAFYSGVYSVLKTSSSRREVNKDITYISIDRNLAERLDWDQDGLPDYLDPTAGVPDGNDNDPDQVFRSVRAKSGFSNDMFNTDILYVCELDTSSYKAHEQVASDLMNRGITAYAMNNLTLDDYRTVLNDVDVCVFATHGGLNLNNRGPVICTNIYFDKCSESDIKEIAEDFNERRIIGFPKGDRLVQIALTSKFFEYYYGNNGFSDTVILSESCHFWGDGKGELNDTILGNTLACRCDSLFVMGFEESVGKDHAFNFVKGMITIYADAEDRLHWDKEKWIVAFDLTGHLLGYTDGEKATAKYTHPLMDGVAGGMPDV